MPRAGDAAAHAHRVYAQLKHCIGRAASAQAVPGADDSTDGSDGPFSGSVCPGGEMFAALVKAPARVLGSDCAGLSSREQHWRRQPLGRMGNRVSRRGELWGIVWRGVGWLNVNRVAYGVARHMAWHWRELGTTHLGGGGGADDRRVLQPLHDARLETLDLRMQVAHLPLYLLRAQDDPSEARMRARTQAHRRAQHNLHKWP